MLATADSHGTFKIMRRAHVEAHGLTLAGAAF